MKLQELMTPKVESIAQQVTMRDAARKMDSLNVGALPVFDADKLVGIVTDRDIACRGVAAGLNPEKATVQEVMTPGVETIDEEAEVESAAKRMKQLQVRRLVVTSREGNVAGIVSLGDLAVRGNVPEQTEAALEQISAPAEPVRS